MTLSGLSSEFSRDGNLQHVIDSTWVSIEEGKVVFDDTHQDYIDLVKENRIKEVTDLFSKRFVEDPRITEKMNNIGWFDKIGDIIEGEIMSGFVDDALRYGTMQYDYQRTLLGKFEVLCNIDTLLTKQTGGGIESNNLDMNNILWIHGKQCGMTSYFPAKVVKQLSEDNLIKFSDVLHEKTY